MSYFYVYGVREAVIGEVDLTREIMRNVYKISMRKPKGKN